MSLTSQLAKRDSPERKFFDKHFPDYKNFKSIWKEMTNGLPPVSFPPENDAAAHRIVGTAVDYRIRVSLEPFLANQTRASHGSTMAGSPVTVQDWGKPDFFDKVDYHRDLNAYVKELWNAISVLWDSKMPEFGGIRVVKYETTETRISTLCVTMAFFEFIYRSRKTPAIFKMAFDNRLDVDGFFNLIFPNLIEDVTHIGRTFMTSESEIYDSKNHILNPSFSGSNDVDGADADLIVDSCLWDIKTTAKPNLNMERWPYQLLGYCFLDYEDEFKLDRIGICLSRQGFSVSWRIEEMMALLGAPRKLTLHDCRKKFKRAARTVTRQAWKKPWRE